MWCSVGFSEDFIAVFLMKMSQIETENAKNPKFSQFQNVYAFFVNVSTDIVDWKVFRG